MAQDIARSGAQSVIVFVSDDSEEYVATAGTDHPTGAQRFRVGSVTKTFTATIVLQLVEEGALDLGDALADHLPGVVPKGDEITIRQLLGHRSGLANITEYPAWLERASRSSSIRPIDTLRFAARQPLVFPPGSDWGYSNTNYIALGLVIERVTGHSYARELEERILQPLELDETELPKTRRVTDLDDSGENPNVPWAAGAIVSNAQRSLPLLFRPALRATPVRRVHRGDEADRRCPSRCARFRARAFRDRYALWTLLGSRRRHPRLCDARQRQRGRRPCCRHLGPRRNAYGPTAGPE